MGPLDTITIEDELGVGGCGGEAPAANRLPPFIGSPIRVGALETFSVCFTLFIQPSYLFVNRIG